MIAQHLRHMLALDGLILSWAQSFLFINIVVLVVVVPATLSIQVVAGTPGLGVFFPQAFAFLLVIYAANFGQMQGNPDQPWRYHYKQHFALYAAHLGLRLSGLMLISLPLWVVYYHVFYLQTSAILALVYLWLLAQLWGWFGFWLSVQGFSEINQFKIKYASLIAYLGATLFVPPLSPFLSIQTLLDPNASPTWYFVLTAFGALGAALFGLWRLIKPKLDQFSKPGAPV